MALSPEGAAAYFTTQSDNGITLLRREVDWINGDALLQPQREIWSAMVRNELRIPEVGLLIDLAF